MFSRWGALVYRFRRPVVAIAVLLAVASSVLATQTIIGPVGRRMAGRELGIRLRSRPVSTPSSAPGRAR